MGKEKERDARERLSTLLLCGPRVRCTTPAGGGGRGGEREGSIVRVVTMVEQNLNRRIELYSKPRRLPPRRSFPSTNQPRFFSWLFVTANQPIPPPPSRTCRFSALSHPCSPRELSFFRTTRAEWRKDARTVDDDPREKEKEEKNSLSRKYKSIRVVRD